MKMIVARVSLIQILLNVPQVLLQKRIDLGRVGRTILMSG